MIHTKNPGVLFFFFVITCFFFSCTKNVPGPQGDKGDPGKPGNLKQSHYNAIKIDSTDWALSLNNEWETSYFVPDLTKNILEKGEVKLYMQIDSQWWGVPYGNGFIFTQYYLEPEFIRLKCKHAHGGIPSRPPTRNYRLVIFSAAQ